MCKFRANPNLELYSSGDASRFMPDLSTSFSTVEKLILSIQAARLILQSKHGISTGTCYGETQRRRRLHCLAVLRIFCSISTREPFKSQSSPGGPQEAGVVSSVPDCQKGLGSLWRSTGCPALSRGGTGSYGLATSHYKKCKLSQ